MGAARRHATLSLLFVAVALLVGGCGGASGGSGEASDSADLRRLLVASADRLESQQSASFRVTMTGSVAGQRLVGTGSGVIDFAAASSSMQMTLDVGSQQVEMEQVTVGATSYMRPSGTGQWMSIDFNQLAGADPSQALMSDPTGSLELLTTAAGDVETIGTEQVDGVDTTHYRVELDPSKLEEDASATSGMLAGTIPTDIWIDDEGFPRRQVTTFKLSGAGTFEMKMEYADLGVPVSIEAPDASQVTAINPATLGSQPSVR